MRSEGRLHQQGLVAAGGPSRTRPASFPGPPRLPSLQELVLMLALVAVCCASPLAAQTNLETNAGVTFNFSTPGAGNLALGGAFLALAFDASAAYTNPAGLTQISAPEAVVEIRHWRFTHVFTDRGRMAGQEPTGNGEDTLAGLRDGEEDNQVTGPSFLSYVRPHGPWSFAFYSHELVNFEAGFSTHGAYLERIRARNPLGIGVPGERAGRLAALRNRMELEVTAYGAAAARRLGKNLSLGLAVSYFDFRIDSTAERFVPDLFAPPDFSRDPLLNVQTQKGEDSDWSAAAGFLWEGRQKRWSVGGVYRRGPEFAFRARSRRGEGLPDRLRFDEANQEGVFHVPDVYGVGVAFRPRDALRIALDYDRVLYSQLTEDFVDIFDLAVLAPGTEPELDRFRVDDADEVHLGLEYTFLDRWPVLAVRGGGWYESDHSLRFEGENVGYRAVFRPRGDQVHYTAGVGMALRRIQVDLAVDYSQRVSVVSLSAGFRF